MLMKMENKQSERGERNNEKYMVESRLNMMKGRRKQVKQYCKVKSYFNVFPTKFVSETL